jgi:integrase
MMARTKKDRRGYIAGEKGRNRVRTFACPKTGIMQIEWREGGRKLSKSLKHRDFEKAKRQADQFAASYVAPRPEAEAASPPEPLTLGKLFEMYLEEVTPTKSKRSRKHDRRALRMFEGFFGTRRDAASLSKRDWDRFLRARFAGEVGPSADTVSARTVERDIRLLQAVFNWAEKSNDESGAPLLHRNPFRGLTPPREKNPIRVVLTDEEYDALLGVSREVDWRFHVALVLAHETGHRIGAIRRLRWSDVDLDERRIRWRAETEKNGHEHFTPMTGEARGALLLARDHQPGIGDAPVFPAPKDPAQSVSRYLMRDWWKRAERSAGLEPQQGRGWHSLRRKFASDYMHKPLKILCDLGGWKTHRTVVECYQHPDEGQLREALQDRRRASTAGMNGGNH